MQRKRLTEVLPFLLPLRVKQREFVYYTKMKHDKHDYAHIKASPLSENIISTKTNTINPNTEFDIKYQYNKLENLKMIAKSLNGLIIKPNEVFSFNLSIQKDTKNYSFKEGLVIVNGEMKTEVGGGICHMSNQLYQSFLYTPLSIIERHPHRIDYFPPKDVQALMGIDATVSSGWLDLKVKNETDQLFQLDIQFENDVLMINILSDRPWKYEYALRNENIDYITKNDKTYKQYDLIREVYYKNSLDKRKEEKVASDLIELAYQIKENSNV